MNLTSTPKKKNKETVRRTARFKSNEFEDIWRKERYRRE